MSMDELRQLYTDYLEQARFLEKNRRLGEGFLGFGRRRSMPSSVCGRCEPDRADHRGGG